MGAHPLINTGLCYPGKAPRLWLPWPPSGAWDGGTRCWGRGGALLAGTPVTSARGGVRKGLKM